MTQIEMDTSSVTLGVGPQGLLAEIEMDASGDPVRRTPVSTLMVQPSGMPTMTPTLMFGSGGGFYFAGHQSYRDDRRRTVGPLPLI